jgi:hypothetical protein
MRAGTDNLVYLFDRQFEPGSLNTNEKFERVNGKSSVARILVRLRKHMGRNALSYN